MTLTDFYERHATFVPVLTPRLVTVADLVEAERPASMLDIGCGAGVLLREISERCPATRLVGVDAVPGLDPAWTSHRVDLSSGIPLDDQFDVIVAGEIIEHLPDPDLLVNECRRLLRPGGALVVTTPNLAWWVNRILLPLGIQPMFTEVSTTHKLGRRHPALGQGNPPEGHLRVFTSRALRELLELHDLRVETLDGLPFWLPKPLDRLDGLLSRRAALAADLVVVARRPHSG